MRVFRSAEGLPPIKFPVVTVGSYDGVHFGHRALLEQVKTMADEAGGESVVVTFWPHPRRVLPDGGGVKLLNTLDEKLWLLREAGIDDVVVLPFTAEFARMSSDDFVREILVGKIGMKRFVVGYNHRFGSGQQGDFASLQRMQGELGFVAVRVGRRDVHEEKVSSTVVRNMIASGEMAHAAEFLTRGYILIADIRRRSVLPGDTDTLLPPPGAYPVTVEAGGKLRRDELLVGEETLRLAEWNGGDCGGVLITFI